MKKNIIIRLIPVACAMFALAGCIGDDGNYDYQPVDEVMPVEISGIPEEAVYELLSEVKITPEIKGMDNPENYEFAWYVYSLSDSNNYDLDTLSTERNLDFTIRFPLGEQKALVFAVKDKRTGVYIRNQSRIESSSGFSTGWFVLNSEDGRTDIDLVLPDGEVVENLLYAVQGVNLEGEAVSMIYYPMFNYEYFDEEGKVKVNTNNPSYILMTNEDMKAVSIGDFTVYADLEDMFYIKPDRLDLKAIHTSYPRQPGLYVINGNNLHSFSYFHSDPVRLPYQVQWQGEEPLQLSQYMIAGVYSYYGRAMIYDRSSRSFIESNTYSTTLNYFPEREGEGADQWPTMRNMPVDLVWMGEVTRVPGLSGTQAWAIMQGVDDPTEYWLYSMLVQAYGNVSYPVQSFTRLGATRNLVTADVRKASEKDATTIYFGKGNQLYYYQRTGEDATSTERNIHTFDAGETVTFIDIIRAGDNWKLAVTTSVGDNWKLYLFDIQTDSPNLDSTKTPAVHTGKGKAGCVIYR